MGQHAPRDLEARQRGGGGARRGVRATTCISSVAEKPLWSAQKTCAAPPALGERSPGLLCRRACRTGRPLREARRSPRPAPPRGTCARPVQPPARPAATGRTARAPRTARRTAAGQHPGTTQSPPPALTSPRRPRPHPRRRPSPAHHAEAPPVSWKSVASLKNTPLPPPSDEYDDDESFVQ